MGNVYTDIPRFYTALAEWAACMVYVLSLQKRIQGIKRYSLYFGYLVIQSAFLVFTEECGMVLWIPCMLGAAGMMFLFMYSCIQNSVLTVCLIWAKAFLVAEFAASLEWQLHVFFFSKSIHSYYWIQSAFLLIVYITVFGLVFFMERKTGKYLDEVSKKDCVMAVGIAIIAFSFSNLSFIFSNTPFTSSIQADIFIIRTLVDLCGIALMFVLQIQIHERIAEKEINAVRAALKSQYEQYRNYQESFEMMNMKYHDIKHQIAGVRAEKNLEKRNQWLDEMEKELDIYSLLGHTGNHVLDGILAGKNIHCQKHNIKITCVADGKLLNSIHVTDLCTIFGNALDNAIECVSLIEDDKKRVIHLAVSKEKNFIYIQIENYCEKEFKIGKNQLPETTKKDKKEHGYGLQSIKHTVEKYKGSMIYTLENSWFELKILIPYHV